MGLIINTVMACYKDYAPLGLMDSDVMPGTVFSEILVEKDVYKV
jgi:hypothetical protein